MQGLLIYTVDSVVDNQLDPMIAPVGMITQCYRKKAEIRGVDISDW